MNENPSNESELSPPEGMMTIGPLATVEIIWKDGASCSVPNVIMHSIEVWDNWLTLQVVERGLSRLSLLGIRLCEIRPQADGLHRDVFPEYHASNALPTQSDRPVKALGFQPPSLP